MPLKKGMIIRMNNKTLIIGLDNGNKDTKVHNKVVFNSGFVENEVEPISKSNLMIYKNKFYTIGQQRFPVKIDKTTDEKTFILSLAAISTVIDQQQESNCKYDVILGTGLPIVYFGKFKESFKNYFIRDNIRFTYNDKDYNFNIKENFVFPQGYSGLIPEFSALKSVPIVNCIDIGFYSVDVFTTEFGILNIGSSFSLPNGIIYLLQMITQEIMKSGINITENQVEQIIMNNEAVIFENQIIEDEIVDIVVRKTKEFVDDLIAKITERGIETRLNQNIVLGGGGLLLKKYIENSDRFKYVEFKGQDANAVGYRMLVQAKLAR